MNNPILSDSSFVFILGRGRSGTSLLQTILNAHPHVSVAPEAQFILYLYRKYKHCNWTEKTIKQFASDIWLEQRLQNWNLDKDILHHTLLSNLNSNPTYSDLCSLVYYSYALTQKKDKISVIGDKNPHYALFGDLLAHIFPKAKFIFMIRDPRDTVLSYKNVDFDANNPAVLAHRWNIYNKAILKAYKKYSEQFIFLKFEDLLENPEKQLKRISDFLLFDYDPKMLQFYKKDQEWNTEFRKNLSKPLDKNNMYKWKNKMPVQEQKIVGFICRKLLKQFSYEPSLDNLSFKQKIQCFTARIHAWILTGSEKIIFFLPPKIIAAIINIYRKYTNTY
ncbi:MAG: sulfotransferase family protein [Bacteroidota bacterium]